MNVLSLKSVLATLRAFMLSLNLQRRDKIALALAGAAVVLFILVQLIVFPILDRGDRLRNQIRAKQKTLQEVMLLQAEYQSLTRHGRDSQARLDQRDKGFRLFSFLDDLAGKGNIKSNITYMKPTTSNLKNSPYALSMVEMKIDGLTMEQLLNFVHGVESSPNMVWIKRISIARGEKAEDLLDATLQVETYQL